MIQRIFFDLDDTLLDFQKAEAAALTRALGQARIACTPAVLARYHVLNQEQWQLLERGLLSREQVLLRRFDLLFAELGAERSSEAVCRCYEGFLAEGHVFLPGAEALLRRLAPRYELYLASNGASAVQRSRLKSADLEQYFRGIFISEELGADKPQKAFFDACFAAIPDFSRETALMVGDSLTSDIRGGHNAGIRTCWFNAQYLPAREDITPEYTIFALEELVPLLERL
ncbi:YjjG family noncanonical pyrimidine nucleotidase [Oscillibacter sp.]|uniref:YjjG family noncanonical pyrimidine nucleotidase n=1 Tax=Oscillibacter sp. TaxID=1945593 RepID=UPI002608CE9C|nr:YjjG family noncanonical pyrimidine nucleotidase [Oscillibacter sp.]MDD3347490.1 YjjG family noncanonical pyrimidine nucleotidase [Oscillibacter sp.]